MTKSIRKPDFMRTSLLSHRGSLHTTNKEREGQKRNATADKTPATMAKHLEDELQLAAIKMDKLATKGTKKRRRSADSRDLLGSAPMSTVRNQSSDEETDPHDP